MTKTELIEKVQAETGLTKKDIGAVVDSTIGSITQALVKGEKVSLVGFGTFQVSHRNARTGKNPQTGEKIEIPARKVPKFTPGKGLKEKVN
ncbi:MAG: HU family DNA-binding protein [Actinomycetota bacterium]|nr:HU family DNA-binding protein [Actinomycetota bacterium]